MDMIAEGQGVKKIHFRGHSIVFYGSSRYVTSELTWFTDSIYCMYQIEYSGLLSVKPCWDGNVVIILCMVNYLTLWSLHQQRNKRHWHNCLFCTYCSHNVSIVYIYIFSLWNALLFPNHYSAHRALHCANCCYVSPIVSLSFQDGTQTRTVA